MDTTPSDMPASALVAELSHRALLEGGNTGVWPGLTILPVHLANRPELGRDPVAVLVHRRPGTQGGHC